MSSTPSGHSPKPLGVAPAVGWLPVARSGQRRGPKEGTMQDLRLVGVHEDGRRVVLVGPDGQRFACPSTTPSEQPPGTTGPASGGCRSRWRAVRAPGGPGPRARRADR